MEFCLFLWLSVGIALLWKHSFCKWYLKLKFESLEQFGLPLSTSVYDTKSPMKSFTRNGYMQHHSPWSPLSLCVLCSSHFWFLYLKKIWKFKSKPEFVLTLSGWDILWKMNPSCDYGVLFSPCLCFYDLTNHILTAPWLSLSFCPGGAPCSFPACTACN